MRGASGEQRSAWPFDPGPRFALQAHIGSGGFGDVYEAFDAELEMAVALKTLRGAEMGASVQLKREFRALADVAHENLLTLYDLFISPSHGFFTMELVRGSTFIEHVRGHRTALISNVRRRFPPMEATASGSTLGDEEGLEPAPKPELSRSVLQASCDEDLVRDAVLQLAKGVSALHAAGKLHRDLKPSNVLVDAQGRVLVSDFGLVVTTAHGRQRHFAGTPAYTAPEQAHGEATPACDWYSVGCMLFEALTGERPFSGDSRQVLVAKQQFEPPPVEGVSGELAELAGRLLARDPRRRPAAEEVIRTLSRNRVTSVSARRTAGEFVGRTTELARLEQAMQRPGFSAVHVVAPSGVGKSALLSRFREMHPNALWLHGRCNERETMPYNAIDGVIDSLCEELQTWPEAERRAVVPDEVGALAQLFPALGRAAELDVVAPAHDDRDRVRIEAFAALQALLTRLSERQPTFVVIDDMQWADRDSRTLLSEVFAEDAPPVHVLLASRPSTFDAPWVDKVALAPLESEEAALLAASLVGSEPDDDRAMRIAREAGGHPLFIRELACSDAGDAIGLDDALWSRAERLDAAARQMVELLSVAGEGLPSAIVRAAAKLEPAMHERTVRDLCVQGFVRRSTERGRPLLETHHDRVREAVVHRLEEATKKQRHHALATAALEGGLGEERPRVVMRHLEAAGERREAAVFAERAAEQAEAALAFDNAAELLTAALRLGVSPSRTYALTRRLADALRAAGRGPESAAAYLRIAEEGDEPSRWHCRQRAGEQLLTSGRINEGIAVLGELLDRLDEPLPRTNAAAMWRLLRERVALRRRGFRWTPRNADAVSEEELQRLAVLRSVAFGLGAVDNLRAALYGARALALALDLGVPALVAEALATHAVFIGSQSTSQRVGARGVLARVRSISETTDDANVHAWLHAGTAILDAFDGIPDAPDRMADAAEIFRERTIGSTWNVNSLKLFQCLTLRLRGDFVELQKLYDEALREAKRQNNRYMETTVRRGGTLLFLAADDVDGAYDNHHAQSWDPTPRGMHIQHFLGLESSCLMALYQGRGGAAFRRHGSELRRMFTSLVMRLQRVRVLGHWLCGTLAAADGSRRARLVAGYCRRALEREDVPYADLFARLLRVSIALSWHGDADRELDDLMRLASRLGWPLYRAMAELIAGRQHGDDARAGEADATLRGLGVADPVRFSRLYVPSRRI